MATIGVPHQGSNIEHAEPEIEEVERATNEPPVDSSLPDSSRFAADLESQIHAHDPNDPPPRLEINLPGTELDVPGLETSSGPAAAAEQTDVRQRSALLPAMQESWQRQLTSRVAANQELRRLRQDITATQVSGQLPQLAAMNTHLPQERVRRVLESVSIALDNIPPSSQSATSERQADIGQRLNNLSTTLGKLSRAWEARSLATGNTDAAAPAHGHHHHHDEGGAIIVDLDEAIHGVYAAVGYLIQAFKGGSGGVAQQFQDNANLLAHHPAAWITDSEAPHGSADFGISVGIAAILIPLALLAIKAGVEEMHGAAHTRKELKNNIEKLEKDIAGLASSGLLKNAQVPREIAMLFDEVNRERLAAMNFLAKQNKGDKGVGLFSATAGSAILVKATAEVAEKAAYIATGANHAAVMATQVVGYASTFALGPVAGAAATGLGGYALQKSRRKRDAFRAEKQSTEARIGQLLGGHESTEEVASYIDFVVAKLEQHDDFFSGYTKWNKSFVGGSGLYTAATAAKMGVAIAAFAGASALSHGAVPAALLAGVTVGGVAMGVSSNHFITGHGRQQRYQGYYKNDDPELDRNFLAEIDLLGSSGSSPDRLRGLKLRADFFSQISDRDILRQDALVDIAKKIDKQYKDEHTYTADPQTVVDRRRPNPTPGQALISSSKRAAAEPLVRLNAARKFVTQTAKSQSISSGKAAAQKSLNDSRDYLTESDLNAWLSDEKNAGAQIDLMKGMLDPQLDYLEKKVDAKADAYRVASGELNQILSAANAEAEIDKQIQPARELKTILTNLDSDLEQDQARYAQALKVRTALQTLSGNTSGGVDKQELASTIGQFVKVQSGETYDSNAPKPDIDTGRDMLAQFLMKDAPKRHRDLRGKLIETELQATRLRNQSSTAATSA